MMKKTKVNLEKILTPKFMLKGDAGEMKNGHPLFDLKTEFRKKLIGYLNRRPSSLKYLYRKFNSTSENIFDVVSVLKDSNLIKLLDRKGDEIIFAPSFAIFTRIDLELLFPMIIESAKEYAKKMINHKDQFMNILKQNKINEQAIIALFHIYFKKWLEEFMDEKRIFPKEPGEVPKNGDGNFYGYEPYQRLERIGVYDCYSENIDRYDLALLEPVFSYEDQFKIWGFDDRKEALYTISTIVRKIHKEVPTDPSSIKEEITLVNVRPHFEEILNYLTKQNIIIKRDDRYTSNIFEINREMLEELKNIADKGSKIIEKLLTHKDLTNAYEKTSPGKNNVSKPEYRELVGWITMDVALGVLEQKGFFPDITDDVKELYIFNRTRAEL